MSAPAPTIVRCLRRPQAAAYAGVSPSKFDEWVRDGRMPAGRPVDGCVLWDVRALDAAIDEMLYGAQSASVVRLRGPKR